MIYKSKNCIPFLYCKGRTGKDFVFLGKRGSTHAEALWENRKKLNFWGFSLIYGDYLCGRIWCVNSLVKDAPLGLITVWEESCKAGYVADAETMRAVWEKFKKSGINIDNFEIISQKKDENDPAVYSIPVSDYIRLRLSSTNDIEAAYEVQQRKRKHSTSGINPELAQFRNSAGISPSLAKYLTTMTSDGRIRNKAVISESNFKKLVKKMVKEAITRIIGENNKKQ